jgi:hypothetical protein
MSPRALLILALATAPLGASAEPPDSATRIGLHLGVEQFEWSELDPDQPGRQLLEESGPRLTASVTLDNFLRTSEGVVYALEARGYYGEVDYDGETNAGVPVRTEVEYGGVLAEGRAGYRFPLVWAGYGLDLLGGLGAERWSRDIQDAFDANGNPVVGYEEVYTVTFAKAGLALTDMTFEEWFGRLEAGVRYPLSVDERIDALNADLSPGADPSWYAAYEISKRTVGGTRMGLTLYYDSYRLTQSPTASSAIGLVRQPESDMDVIGVRFGVFL